MTPETLREVRLDYSLFFSHTPVLIRVLLIEDSPGDTRLIQEMLAHQKAASFDLICADRLSTGLEQLASHNIDIVLLDLGLPDSQGLETIIKIVDRVSNGLIVVLTGREDESLALKALQKGVHDYLFKKQLNANLLVRSIGYAIERQRLMVELTRSDSARFRYMIEQNGDGIIVVDRQGRVQFANPAAERLLGFRAGKLVGQPVELPLRAAETTEFEIARPGQRAVIAEIRVVEIGWAGEIAYLISIRDITERRQLEEQRNQAQKLEAVGKLAGGVAHNFNGLLTVIIGYSEVLLPHLDPQDPLRKDIEQIKQAGERAAFLTRRLLDFSRRRVLQPGLLNLNRVVVEMDEALRGLIGRDIELIAVLEPELGWVKADPDQIRQILTDLASNARDAMLEGGQLIIRTANVDLDESFARRRHELKPGSYVILAISDTGSGIDKKTQARIFEPFFTTKEQGQGLGLGLAAVYGIVKQNDGFIWLYSEAEQGTTFTIYLPRLEPGYPSAERGRNPAPAGQISETILLVEDEELVREVAGRTLARAGYEVLTAAHGPEALKICQRHPGPIHLLVTDVAMPGGMNGYEVAEQLIALKPKMKVLYITGYSGGALTHHGVLEPGAALLEKPFSPDMLAAKVRQILDRGGPDQG